MGDFGGKDNFIQSTNLGGTGAARETSKDFREFVFGQLERSTVTPTLEEFAPFDLANSFPGGLCCRARYHF